MILNSNFTRIPIKICTIIYNYDAFLKGTMQNRSANFSLYFGQTISVAVLGSISNVLPSLGPQMIGFVLPRLLVLSAILQIYVCTIYFREMKDVFC